MSYTYLVVKPDVQCFMCSIGIGRTQYPEGYFYHTHSIPKTINAGGKDVILCEGCEKLYKTSPSFKKRTKASAKEAKKKIFRNQI